MNDGPEAVHDFPAPTPAPPELIEQAWSLVGQGQPGQSECGN
jgi:hypothetical protein